MLLTLLSVALAATSFLFSRLHHPLAMGLTLITQTLLVCLASGLMSTFLWMSYILFLVFLGATLVLFIYVASLASNEMFKLSYPLAATIAFPITALLPLTLMTDHLMINTKSITEGSSVSHSEIIEDPSFTVAMIYSPSSSFLTSFIILYLLMTLIVIVKLTSPSSGPLRLLS